MNGNGNESPFGLGLIEQAEKAAEEDRNTALRIYPQIQNAVSWLEQASGASREARDRLSEKIAEAQRFLNTHLKHEVPAIRRAVWLAILGFELSRAIESRAEAEVMLATLVRRNLFQEAPDGDLRAYGKAYRVHHESNFGDPEKAEARTLFHALLNRAKEGFLVRANLTLDQLFKGERGEVAVEVPPEKVVQNGKPVWLGGGVLRVKSDGEFISPEDAMGPIEGAVRGAKELNIRLLVKSLQYPQPPFVKGLDAQRGGKVRLIWRLLKRAERLAKEKKTFPTRATVSAEEFFLNGETGICLVDFGSTVWEEKDLDGRVVSRFYSVFFLVERQEKEGRKRLHIVEVPDHLVDFFGPCMAEADYEEGNKFAGVPYPLSAILRVAFSRTLKASDDAEKAGQVVTRTASRTA